MTELIKSKESPKCGSEKIERGDDNDYEFSCNDCELSPGSSCFGGSK